MRLGLKVPMAVGDRLFSRGPHARLPPSNFYKKSLYIIVRMIVLFDLVSPAPVGELMTTFVTIATATSTTNGLMCSPSGRRRACLATKPPSFKSTPYTGGGSMRGHDPHGEGHEDPTREGS
ncbi:hypothetical protein EVAR_87039_1 [Eumeta japonica]|uniref:Uncharacterized protein n=1 Tax=Eumeta variegata TaxID=151549 RepID=A0A4C1Z3T1_EUMVA|nr:hypothetical protein EVAR_87039_1 [Eumeta japonica]